jgi:hypothetical protein
MMRKISILMLATAALFAGCIESDPVPELSAAPATVNAADAGGSHAIAVTSNVDWTAIRDHVWFTFSPASGSGNGSITVNVTENTATEPREATITVKAGRLIETITVTQLGATPSLLIDVTDIDAVASANSYTMTMTSNTAWSAKSNEEWITLSPPFGTGNGTITVNVAENTTPEPRTAIITIMAGPTVRALVGVTDGSIVETVTVTQAAATPAP